MQQHGVARCSLELKDLGLSDEELDRIAAVMDSACRNMWAMVLERAIRDAIGQVDHIDKEDTELYGSTERAKKGIQKRALRWIESESPEVRSFRWICLTLNHDPAVMRMAVNALVRRKKVKPRKVT